MLTDVKRTWHGMYYSISNITILHAEEVKGYWTSKTRLCFHAFPKEHLLDEPQLASPSRTFLMSLGSFLSIRWICAGPELSMTVKVWSYQRCNAFWMQNYQNTCLSQKQTNKQKTKQRPKKKKKTVGFIIYKPSYSLRKRFLLSSFKLLWKS